MSSPDTLHHQLLDEMLADTARVAVVVIDMQEDFCAPWGASARAGMDVSANQRIVQPIQAFTCALRSAGALVVWIRQAISPDHISPATLRRLRRAPERLDLCGAGTPGAALAAGLQPAPSDPVIDKFRYSAFLGSSLDLLLRSRGIQTVVLVGTAANGCVDSTARDAAQLDYDVLIPRDLTGHTDAALAQAALRNLDRHFALVCEAGAIVDRVR